MPQTIADHFDGEVIVPDGPVDLSAGQRLTVRIEPVHAPEPRFAVFLDFAADLSEAPPDLAAQHDHYFYGSPKR